MSETNNKDGKPKFSFIFAVKMMLLWICFYKNARELYKNDNATFRFYRILYLDQIDAHILTFSCYITCTGIFNELFMCPVSSASTWKINKIRHGSAVCVSKFCCFSLQSTKTCLEQMSHFSQHCTIWIYVDIPRPYTYTSIHILYVPTWYSFSRASSPS